MDVDCDYDQSEHDAGHRPNSRASQQSSRSMESGNGYAGHHRRNERQGMHHDAQQISPYAYQQSQFDEPDRDEDDDMW